jgi:hypothetical protein
MYCLLSQYVGGLCLYGRYVCLRLIQRGLPDDGPMKTETCSGKQSNLIYDVLILITYNIIFLVLTDALLNRTVMTHKRMRCKINNTLNRHQNLTFLLPKRGRY